MKSNILTVMKKELTRAFTDKRMLFGTLLLPGLMIYIIYSFMGDGMSNLFQPDETISPIAVVEMPDSMKTLFDSAQIPYEVVSEEEVTSIQTQIADKNANFLMIFPENFDADVAAYEITSGMAAPNIAIYYNSADTGSSSLYSQILTLLNSYEATLINKFDVNAGEAAYDLAKEEDLGAMIYSSMMPLLLLIFLFSACVSIGPEAIAGEKERGTLSTLLVTPMKRSELAVGKILALSILAILGAVSSTIGTLLSLPKLMGGAMGSTIAYTVTDYIFLSLIIIATVLLFISIVSIISAFAKTIKEAQTYISPLMIVIMVIGVTSMFGSFADSSLIYLIPVYNSVQCISAIFSYEIVQSHILITVASNIVYSGILAFVLTKMFNSEKIMFSR